jgi:hypothetical protein
MIGTVEVCYMILVWLVVEEQIAQMWVLHCFDCSLPSVWKRSPQDIARSQ